MHRRRALRHNLLHSVVDSGGFSVMVGIAETYFAAFALLCGLGEALSGLAASLPMLFGSLLQLVTPRGVVWLGSHRRWTVACAALQGTSFVPLLIAALHGGMPGPLLFLTLVLYFGAGQAASPTWNTWIDLLVPRHIRPRYFAQRSRIANACLLFGVVTGGLTLAAAAARQAPFVGFAVVFGAALVARVISVRFLSRQTPEPVVARSYPRLPLRMVLRRFGQGPDGRLILYMLVVQSTVQVAAPFFAPFMLGELGLTYDRYMILQAVALLARVAALPLFGAIAKRLGARRLLWLGGAGIVPLAGLWVVSDNYYYLIAIQVLGGVAWSGYELATQLLTLETIKTEERTSVMTLFNLKNSLAIALGAALGGLLLGRLGQDREAFHVIFTLSTLGRLGSLGLLWYLWRRMGSLPRAQPAGSSEGFEENRDARSG